MKVRNPKIGEKVMVKETNIPAIIMRVFPNIQMVALYTPGFETRYAHWDDLRYVTLLDRILSFFNLK